MSNWKPTSGPTGPMVIDIECPRCHGTGMATAENALPNDRPYTVTVKCSGCEGYGVVEHDLNDDIEDWME